MPIDQALEDIETDEDQDAKKDESIISKSLGDGSLVDTARDYMGDVLIDFFRNQLPGQSGDTEPFDSMFEPLIKEIGLDFFTIRPAADPFNQRPLIDVMYNQELDDGMWEKAIKLMCGDYSDKTDLIHYIKKDKNEIFEKVPEFRYLHEKFLSSGSMNRSDRDIMFDRATFHPYLIVMSMPYEYRTLGTLAVTFADTNGRFNLPRKTLKDVSLDQPERFPLNYNWMKNQIRNITPLSKDYVDVAEKYSLTDITKVMESFEKIGEVYLDAWKG